MQTTQRHLARRTGILLLVGAALAIEPIGTAGAPLLGLAGGVALAVGWRMPRSLRRWASDGCASHAGSQALSRASFLRDDAHAPSEGSE